MRRIPLLGVTLLLGLGCGPEALPVEALADCDGLEVRALESSVDAPARISARVRVTGCGGRSLKAPITSASFELAEDGLVLSRHEAQWEIRQAEQQVAEMTLVALDLSGSVSRSGLKAEMVEGARRLVTRLVPLHRVAIFGFDGRPELVPYAYFTDDYDVLMEALDRILSEDVIDDSTNLYGAVIDGLRTLDEAVTLAGGDEQRIAHGSLVVFTDGDDRAKRVTADATFDATTATSHSTYAIALGSAVPIGVLDGIGRTARQVATDGNDIVRAIDQTATELRNRARRDFDVGYCSPSRAGRHAFKISVTQGTLRGAVAIAFDADEFGAGCQP